MEPHSDAVLLLGVTIENSSTPQLSLVVYEPAVNGETTIGQLEYRESFASVLLNGESGPLYQKKHRSLPFVQYT